jgi:hypothetical protein
MRDGVKRQQQTRQQQHDAAWDEMLQINGSSIYNRGPGQDSGQVSNGKPAAVAATPTVINDATLGQLVTLTFTLPPHPTVANIVNSIDQRTRA